MTQPTRAASTRARAAERWRGPSLDEETAAFRSDASATANATAPVASGDVRFLTHDGKKRIVVTGMGCVTALGNDVDAFYESLLNGESAVSSISEWAMHPDFSTTIAAEIKGFDPEEFMTKKMARRVDPFIAYQIVAAKKALQHAKLPFAKGEEMDAALNITKSGCLIGSAMGGLHSFSAATEALHTQGHRKMNPFCIPFAITNMGSALTAMDLGFMGPNYSISSACASGNFCILNSVEHIRNGEADLMLAGASDAAILPSGMGGFCSVKAMSKRNDDPQKASRPWDKNRDGFVMGEGAGVLVMESLGTFRGFPKSRHCLMPCTECSYASLTTAISATESADCCPLCINRPLQDSGLTLSFINLSAREETRRRHSVRVHGRRHEH